jgi:acylphosphatase
MEDPARPGIRPVPKPGPHLAGALRRSPAVVARSERDDDPREDGRDDRQVAGRHRGDLATSGAPARLTALVAGTVQGVGFRWWTRSRALELGLVGTATNLPDGRVEVVAEGRRHGCERLLELLAEQPPRDPPPRAPRSWYRRPGVVTAVEHGWAAPHGGLAGFREG